MILLTTGFPFVETTALIRKLRKVGKIFLTVLTDHIPTQINGGIGCFISCVDYLGIC